MAEMHRVNVPIDENAAHMFSLLFAGVFDSKNTPFLVPIYSTSVEIKIEPRNLLLSGIQGIHEC